MKPHPFRVFVAIPAALLLGLAAVPQASALTPRGRLVEGAVIAVHPPTREASIRRQQTPQPLEFQWTRHTDFIRGTSFVAPTAALRPGARVRVTYHKPIFGPATVSRVVLLCPQVCRTCS